MSSRLDTVFDAPSTASYFDALADADSAVSDANYNALLAETAPIPTTFGQCLCGSHYSVADSRIVLSESEQALAVSSLVQAALPSTASAFDKAKDYLRNEAVYISQIQAAIDAINAARQQSDREFVDNWNDSHAYCGEQW